MGEALGLGAPADVDESDLRILINEGTWLRLIMEILREVPSFAGLGDEAM